MAKYSSNKQSVNFRFDVVTSGAIALSPQGKFNMEIWSPSEDFAGPFCCDFFKIEIRRLLKNLHFWNLKYIHFNISKNIFVVPLPFNNPSENCKLVSINIVLFSVLSIYENSVFWIRYMILSVRIFIINNCLCKKEERQSSLLSARSITQTQKDLFKETSK